MGVTRRQRWLVQRTWEQVVPISETAAGLFYGRLFEIAPELERFFPADERAMREQERKLVRMITAAVRGLDHPDELIPTVEQLGRRHVSYGVRDSDYATVGATLLWTLRQGLGESFTPEVEEAWAATYALLADTMKAGAASSPRNGSERATLSRTRD